jgi:hypothetical protein
VPESLLIEARPMSQEMHTMPLAGEVTISPSSGKMFIVHCGGLTVDEQRTLVDFFNEMGGRFGAFRFEYGPIVHLACRFDSDELPHEVGGSGPYSLTFPIKVLRAQP